MAILTFRVKGQTLTVESKIDKIVENSINYLDYEIIYDDEKWDSPLAKKVVVTYDKKTYEFFGDKIPSQVIHAPGFRVSVIGYKSGSETDSGIIITTSPVAIKVFPSGAIEGTIPEDTAIDPSVAEQLNEKIEIQANEIKNNYLSKDLLKTTINENSTNLEVPAAKAVYDCIKPLKTELLEKVNKSDILSNIDINAKPEDIYNAPAVNTAIAELEKGTIITLDTVNIWELEAGVYYVNTRVYYATPNPPSSPNRVDIHDKKGLLYVQVTEGGDNSRDFYLVANKRIYFGTSTYITGDAAKAVGSISNVYASIRTEITKGGVDGIPTKNAVYNFGETIKTELLANIGDKADKTDLESLKTEIQGNLDEVSSLVGGA